MHWESVRASVWSLWTTGVMLSPCKDTPCCAHCCNQGTGMTVLDYFWVLRLFHNAATLAHGSFGAYDACLHLTVLTL